MGETAGSAAAPTARCRNRRRGSFMAATLGRDSQHEAFCKFPHTDLFSIYSGFPDNRPPLIDFALLKCAERILRLLLAWHGLLPKVGEPLAHCRISQGVHLSTIELGNNILRRSCRRPKPVPKSRVEAR